MTNKSDKDVVTIDWESSSYTGEDFDEIPARPTNKSTTYQQAPSDYIVELSNMIRPPKYTEAKLQRMLKVMTPNGKLFR